MARRFSLAIEDTKRAQQAPSQTGQGERRHSTNGTQPLHGFLIANEQNKPAPPARSLSLSELENRPRSPTRKYSVCDLNTIENATQNYTSKLQESSCPGGFKDDYGRSQKLDMDDFDDNEYIDYNKKSKLNSGSTKNHHRRHSTAIKFEYPRSYPSMDPTTTSHTLAPPQIT